MISSSDSGKDIRIMPFYCHYETLISSQNVFFKVLTLLIIIISTVDQCAKRQNSADRQQRHRNIQTQYLGAQIDNLPCVAGD